MFTAILQPILVEPITAMFGDKDVTSIEFPAFSNGFSNGFLRETYDE